MLSIKNLRIKVRKLTPKFISPFKILEYVGNSAYKLELPSIYIRLYPTFYISFFKEYIVRKGQEPDQYLTSEFLELEDNNDEQEQEVESIVDYKEDRRSKVRKYLIKQKSQLDNYNTQLPTYLNLANSKELIELYNSLYRLEPSLTTSPLKHQKGLRKLTYKLQQKGSRRSRSK